MWQKVMIMIKTTRDHFWIKFDNGYTVSVFNDRGSYSENYFNKELEESFLKEKNQGIMSEICEIGIIHDEELIHVEEWEDSVKGRVTPNELLETMNKVSKL